MAPPRLTRNGPATRPKSMRDIGSHERILSWLVRRVSVEKNEPQPGANRPHEVIGSDARSLRRASAMTLSCMRHNIRSLAVELSVTRVRREV